MKQLLNPILGYILFLIGLVLIIIFRPDGGANNYTTPQIIAVVFAATGIVQIVVSNYINKRKWK